MKDLRYYLLQEGQSSGIPGNCPYCNQVFEDLRNHLIILYINKNQIKGITQDFPKFNCDTCQLILTNEDCIQKHKQNIHIKGRTYDIIKCLDCNIDFISQKSLNFHRAFCHQNQTWSPLKAVRIVESSVRLHPCNDCGKQFTDFFIKRHMLEKHGKSYSQIQNLKNHTTKFHRGVNSKCNKTLTQANNLKDHKTSDLGNKRKVDCDSGDVPNNAIKLKKISKNENDLELESLKKQIDQKDSEIKKLKEQLQENDSKRDLELQKLKEQLEKHDKDKHNFEEQKLATEKEKLSDEKNELASENTELKSKKRKLIVNGKEALDHQGNWALFESSKGRKYYFNIKTQSNQWVKPQEWIEKSKNNVICDTILPQFELKQKYGRMDVKHEQLHREEEMPAFEHESTYLDNEIKKEIKIELLESVQNCQSNQDL